MILRSMLVAAALVGLATPVVGEAQTCLGLAPFSAGPVQIGGTGDFGNDSKALAAGVTIGSTSGAFGGAFLGTVSYDAFEENTTVVGGSLGWQVAVGKSGRAQMCPGVGVAIGRGPENISGSRANLSSQSAFVGFQIGIFAGEQLRLVPTAGVALVYSKVDFDGSYFGQGQRTDVSGLIDLAVGLVISRVSIRPSVDIPIGLEGADPSLGIMVAINFGRRS
jgi:hypothetical protein